ncbi:Protein of uncharacterised function (DUF2634) [Streptococcus pneumoniae]|jgi:hypothetical protein|nr:Protein of uncharacterised function (DUF2634) [Streptococcus pneumoniae]DAS49179.1 MAG TPA: Protein of unknown function (DUF2634) [Caudoviricetes sp.]
MSTPKTNFLNIAKNVVEAKKQPSLTLDETNILLETDGVHALKQSIRRMLTTERFIYTIYDHRYGVELDALFGGDMDYAQMDIARRIKEALYEDDRIHEVHSFSTKVKKDEFYVQFMVDSDFGTFEMDLEVKR